MPENHEEAQEEIHASLDKEGFKFSIKGKSIARLLPAIGWCMILITLAITVSKIVGVLR